MKNVYSNFSDEKLCDFLKQDDEGAMQIILQRYWEPLYKMAAHTLEDLGACEDIVQEVFINIWESRERLNFKHSLKAYLFASVRYEVFRQVKQKIIQNSRISKHSFTDIELFNPQNKLEYDELMQHIEKIVNRLPDRCREVYQLSRNEQLSHKEIADKLQLTPKTIENQLTIALRRIRLGISKITILFFY